MNDFEAMEAINEVLEKAFLGKLPAYEIIQQIAYITGANKISHEEARQQQ